MSMTMQASLHTALMHLVQVLLVVVLCAQAAPTTVQLPFSGRVLLVSMDGFRWDYLDTISPLPNFEKLARKGSRVTYVNNTFVTSTFPTHYSIATGLYEESHGIVGNRMYDPKMDENFEPGNNTSAWWSDAEPIWITATKQHRKTGCVFFPGTEVELQGMRPALWLNYSLHMPFRDRVDTTINWFVNESIDFGTLYFHEPDASGHKFGPDSPEVADKVREMDAVLGYLLDKMEAHGLDRTVNLFVTSDHGMTNKDLSKVVEVPPKLDMTKVAKFVENECVCHVFPVEGEEEALFEALTAISQGIGMTVYKKEHIPTFWHYSQHRRIPPILLVMDEGWSCATNASASWVSTKGTHGYDNRIQNMKPIFLAKGPDIQPGGRLQSIRSVDIYPFMCQLLGVEPALNNGSLSITEKMLRSHPDYNRGSSTAQEASWWLLLLAASAMTYHTTGSS